MIDCKCLTWARTEGDPRTWGSTHHPRCPHAKREECEECEEAFTDVTVTFGDSECSDEEE